MDSDEEKERRDAVTDAIQAEFDKLDRGNGGRIYNCCPCCGAELTRDTRMAMCGVLTSKGPAVIVCLTHDGQHHAFGIPLPPKPAATLYGALGQAFGGMPPQMALMLGMGMPGSAPGEGG